MSDKKICIEEYSASWALEFQQLRAIYLTRLEDLIDDVQHVGSTSVVGLAAKPILDIDLIIHNKKNLDAVIMKLQMLGYDHLGDLGIRDREAFKARSNQVPFDTTPRRWLTHNLYVCLAGSVSLNNHLAFRDFLRENPREANAYGILKKRLALAYPYDINRYVESKTPFITEVLRRVGFDETSINGIARDNRID